jgi:hypothetical protein
MRRNQRAADPRVSPPAGVMVGDAIAVGGGILASKSTISNSRFSLARSDRHRQLRGRLCLENLIAFRERHPRLLAARPDVPGRP